MIDKRQFVEAIVERLREERESVAKSYESANKATRESPGPMQSRYDTSRHELSEVADATGKRLRELDQLLWAIKRTSNSPCERGKLGAVLEVEEDDKILFFLIVSPGVSAYTVEMGDFTIQSVSTESPIGRALIGKKSGDELKLTTPGGAREFRVLKVM